MILNNFELLDFLKKNLSTISDKICIELEPEGYHYNIEKSRIFGYVLGVPGLDFGKAITFDSPKALLVDDLDSFFELNSEYLDEEYDPEKIYVYIN